MNKKELKAKWEKAKRWCKGHKTELLVILSSGIAGGIAAGGGYKKGWKDACDACDDYAEHHMVRILGEPATPRDVFCDDDIKKIERTGKATELLDKPIAGFWFD